MINDLFDKIHKSVELSQFADNGALWITGQDLQNCREVMQDAMKSLENWSHTWGLHISPEKTAVMFFRRKTNPQESPLLLTGLRGELTLKPVKPVES